VTVVNTGLCASIATIINISVPTERRLSMPNARFLIHQPAIHGQIVGPASDIEITAANILQSRSQLNAMLAEACGQSVEKLERDSARDYWMTAKEALAYGLIGKIVTNSREIR
jgi:ATP-dependent Clp protease protease subunit